jgi:predicted tellurium resistance membrane protein TerC
MELLLDPNLWIAFGMLTALEIVLGIDNIIFLTILVGRLPAARRDTARRLGLGFAMATRILLLLSLSWVMGLTAEVLAVAGQSFSGRDLVLLSGGLFLLWKASREIFLAVEQGDDAEAGAHAAAARPATTAPSTPRAGLFWSVIAQIAVIDIVFSLDSVITAVGMVDRISVMIAAVVASVALMMFAAKAIGEFVDRHPSIKVLALAFLVMVGMTLAAEAFDVHVPKTVIYAAMGFSVLVEVLNIRARSRRAALAARADAAPRASNAG